MIGMTMNTDTDISVCYGNILTGLLNEKRILLTHCKLFVMFRFGLTPG